jgi:hypothetical protein
MMATIQSDAGLSIGGGAFIGLFIGGLLSVPWILCLAGIIWFFGAAIARHPVKFAVIGPLLVCASWAITFGGMIEAVAISTTVSSLCYISLTFWRRWRTTTGSNEAAGL